MADTVGTPRNVNLNGISKDVMSDANISQAHERYENEGVPTSGRTLQKKTAKAQQAESVDIACNAAEYEEILSLSARTDSFPMSYEDAEGNIYRATGFIRIDSPRETETGKVTLHLITENGWSLFQA